MFFFLCSHWKRGEFCCVFFPFRLRAFCFVPTIYRLYHWELHATNRHTVNTHTHSKQQKQQPATHTNPLFPYPQIINGKYVEGFYIYARQLDSINETYKMLTVLNGGGASTCTVTGLTKYQSYEFFIVPFYKSVEGKPSNSRVARTSEDGKWWPILFRLFISLVSQHMCKSELRAWAFRQTKNQIRFYFL